MISIIAAIGENREIGKENKLLWKISEDLKRFKKITFGHPVIMGRKTFKSLKKPLPGRTNIIVTRNKKYKAKGCIICHSIEEAIRFGRKKESHSVKTSRDREVFIIGGGQIYKQTIDLVDKLYLTIVKGKFKADTYFPDYSQFKKVIKEKREKSGGYKYKFLELEK